MKHFLLVFYEILKARLFENRNKYFLFSKQPSLLQNFVKYDRKKRVNFS